jgi:hypothetical protein
MNHVDVSEPSAWCRALGNYSSPHVAAFSIQRRSRDVLFPTVAGRLFSWIAASLATRTLRSCGDAAR